MRRKPKKDPPNKQMAMVDQLLDNLSRTAPPAIKDDEAPAAPGRPSPNPGVAPPRPASARPKPPLPSPKQRPRPVWGWVSLSILLGAGVSQWPYAHECGWTLLPYGGTVTFLIGMGVWSTHMTWKRHLGVAHTVALGVTLWGFILAAGQTLPRVGYAKSEARWTCQGPTTITTPPKAPPAQPPPPGPTASPQPNP